MGAPTPLHTFASPEGRVGLLARPGATWAPTKAPIPTDGMDTTTHNEREHGSRVTIQHDSGYSTTTTFIPLQQWG
jgi:hypothetical protein